MQQQTTNGQPGKRSADYVTLVAQACANVPGFTQLYKDMERSISISGKSASLLTNYGGNWHTWHFILIVCLPNWMPNR